MYKGFVPTCLNIKRKFYLRVLEYLRYRVRRVRPNVILDNWIVRHESALTHKALSIKEFSAKMSIVQLERQIFSSDLVPGDYSSRPSRTLISRDQSWYCRRDSEGFDGSSKQLAEESLLKVLRQRETTLEFPYMLQDFDDENIIQNKM